MKTLLNKDFKQKTINTLRKRAGEMCSICKRLTSIPHTNPDKFINLGEAAHINGQNDAPNKRYDSSLTNEFLSSVANGIWLCRECHKKIDSDDKHYTVKFLNGLKEQHESDLFSGKLNYTKFTEYQKLEFEIYYLKDELSKMNNSELAIELKNAEKEKQQFKEKIEDIERSLLTTNKSLDEAKKCFFEKNDLEATLNIINENNSLVEEKVISQKRLLIAQVKEAQGKIVEAKINYKKSIEIYGYLENLFYFGKFLYINGHYTEAIKTFKRIVGPENDQSVKETKLDYSTIHILNRTCLFLAQIFQSFKDLKSATQYINNSLEFQKYLIQKNPKEIDYHINTLSIQASLLIENGQHKDALKFNNKALELTDLIFEPNSYERASCLANLGINYYNLKDGVNSKKNLDEALNILESKQNHNEKSKSTLAKLYSWLSRLTADKSYCKKALNLYSELSLQNPNKYLREKIISQIDYAGSIDKLEQKEKLYENILKQEEELIKFDKNIYEPLIANVYRIYVMDLISNNKLDKALLKITKSVQLLIKITDINENYLKDLIIALNIKIDLLLHDKIKNLKELENDINLFKSIMKKEMNESKEFMDVFEQRLIYCEEKIKT